MPSNIGKAYVQIVPSAQGISGSISSILSGESESAGKSAGSSIASGIGGVLKTSAAVVGAGLVAATTGAMALAKSAVSNFADYEQLVGGVETLFKDSADIVQDYADQAYKSAGLSANRYMETVTSFSASLLQSLGGDTARAAEVGNMAVVDMADNANKMGTSMESLQNAYQGFAKQNYTMLDNLKLGYGGTKSEMERLLQDATKLTGIKYDIGNLSDVYSAIHVIQESLGITGTTALEAEHTISGSFASMQSAWSNLITGIARNDANISKLITNFVASVKTVINNVMPVVLQSLSGLGQLIEGIAPMLATMIPGIVESVLPPLLSAAGTLLSAFGDALIQNLPMLIDTALMIVTGFVGFLIENLPALMEGAAQLVQGLVYGITDALPVLVPAAIQMAMTIIDNFIEGIDGTVDLIVDAALTIAIALFDGLIDAIPKICEAAPEIILNIIEALDARIPEIIECGVQLLTALIENLPLIIQTILTAVPQIVGELVMSFIKAAPQLWSAGQQLVMGLWDGIKGTMGWLWNKISGFARDVINHVKSSLGIRSPSTLMMEVGDYLMQGLGVGIEENANIVQDAMDGVASMIDGEMTGSVNMTAGMLNTASAATVNANGYAADQQISLLKEQNALLRELIEKSGVYLDGKMISGAMNRYARAAGV